MAKFTKVYKAIGLMSGTSLDGLDIAYCRFSFNKEWKFKIIHALTIPYNDAWRKKLSTAHLLKGRELLMLDIEYGEYIGEWCKEFIRKARAGKPDFIASHGHTIFHRIEEGLTFQLGNGNAIHAVTKIPVVYDFRTLDVLLGGQGAPLVPVGDRHLFKEYDVCLNLGGIANLSYERNGKRVAFDICFVNMALNYLSSKKGKMFDNDGIIASKGVLNKSLLKDLNNYYSSTKRSRPSLGRELFSEKLKGLLDSNDIPIEDRMRTVCESIAREIAKSIPSRRSISRVLVTGGGAHNAALMNIIAEKVSDKATLSIPDQQIVDFKEALIFAFLGVLRMRGEVNVLKSVTKSRKDSSSGIIADL